MTQLPPRLAAFHADGADRIGVVTDAGIIDLTSDFGTRFAGLKEVIEGGAIPEMLAAAEGRQPDYAQDQVRWLIPIANPEKLICSVLWVVVVTKCACAMGEACCPEATSPAMCAISTSR